MPHIVEIEKKFRQDDQFQFLSVACGASGYSSLEAMRFETARYRDRTKMEFPIYFDPDFISRASLESAIGKEPRTLGYPTTVVIDQGGKVAGVWEGYTASLPTQVTATIDRLLVEP